MRKIFIKGVFVTSVCFPLFQQSGFYFPPAAGWSPFLSRTGNVLHAPQMESFCILAFYKKIFRFTPAIPTGLCRPGSSMRISSSLYVCMKESVRMLPIVKKTFLIHSLTFLLCTVLSRRFTFDSSRTPQLLLLNPVFDKRA